MGEGGEPAPDAGSPAHPRLMKLIDPHRQCLKPLLDQIPVNIVQVTAQIAPRECGQVAHAIDEKRRLRKVVFLGQLAEKRGGWIRSTSLGDTNSSTSFVSRSIAAYSQYCSVPIVTAVSSTATRDGEAVLRTLRVLMGRTRASLSWTSAGLEPSQQLEEPIETPLDVSE
jgi:hypothetical protein